MSIERIPIKKGVFITLEGVEGAGKSTMLKCVITALTKAQIPYVKTREPGGTQLAEKIRHILLDPSDEPMSSDTELLLMFASRAQHIHEIILPALRAGKWVISDRFTDATYAYQGGGRGISTARIAQMEDWVQGDLRPDCTLLLDLPVEIGMERISKRKAGHDRIEKEQYEFFERVRNAYLQRAQQSVNQYKIIDAAQPISMVKRQVRDIMQTIIESSCEAI
jgi:dTMP kinase